MDNLTIYILEKKAQHGDGIVVNGGVRRRVLGRRSGNSNNSFSGAMLAARKRGIKTVNPYSGNPLVKTAQHGARMNDVNDELKMRSSRREGNKKGYNSFVKDNRLSGGLSKRKDLFALMGDGPNGRKVRALKDGQGRMVYSERSDKRNPLKETGKKRLYAGAFGGGAVGGLSALGIANKAFKNSRLGNIGKFISSMVGAGVGTGVGGAGAYKTYSPDQKANVLGAKYKTSFKDMARQSHIDEYKGQASNLSKRIQEINKMEPSQKKFDAYKDYGVVRKEMIQDYKNDTSQTEKWMRNAYRK